MLLADSSSTFFCPVEQKTVRWQLADVFNPAAVTRNDSIFLLFRAEDNPAAGIGGRTSRIGLAVSADGLHFQKYEQPVLYPEPGESNNGITPAAVKTREWWKPKRAADEINPGDS